MLYFQISKYKLLITWFNKKNGIHLILCSSSIKEVKLISPILTLFFLVTRTQLSIVDLVLIIDIFLLFNIISLVLDPLLFCFHRFSGFHEDCANKVRRLRWDTLITKSIVIIWTFKAFLYNDRTASITKIKAFFVCKLKDQRVSIETFLS